MSISIRNATEVDIKTIQALTFRVWPQTYQNIISGAQIDFMLTKMYGTASLKRQMTELGIEFLLLSKNDIPVGFAAYGKQEEKVFRLHKLYLLRELQGQGLGKKLLHNIFNCALQKGAKVIELNVNRHNPALVFYFGNGFEIHREEDLDIGNGYFMNDYVLRKKVVDL